MDINEKFLFKYLNLKGAKLITGAEYAQKKNNFCAQLLKMVDPNLFLFYDSIAKRDIDLAWHKGVGIYTPTSKGIVLPSDFPSIEHEIGHFLEIGTIARLKQIDMGMDSDSSVFERGRVQAIFVACAREIRVRQIQKILEGEIVGGTNCKLASKMEDLRVSISWYCSKRLANFGKFSSAKEVDDYMIDMGNRVRKLWTKDKIVFEFKRRCEYMQEHIGMQANFKSVAENIH